MSNRGDVAGPAPFTGPAKGYRLRLSMSLSKALMTSSQAAMTAASTSAGVEFGWIMGHPFWLGDPSLAWVTDTCQIEATSPQHLCYDDAFLCFVFREYFFRFL